MIEWSFIVGEVVGVGLFLLGLYLGGAGGSDTPHVPVYPRLFHGLKRSKGVGPVNRPSPETVNEMINPSKRAETEAFKESFITAVGDPTKEVYVREGSQTD